MNKLHYKNIIHLFLFLSSSFGFAQTTEQEDPKKMYRDVVNLDVSRYKRSVKPQDSNASGSEPRKNKKNNEEITDQGLNDTLPPTMPAPIGEILKRAQAWCQAPVPNKKYVKSNISSSGKALSCNATFTFKQKILNPENEVDGKFVMDVIIEAKEGKYRYTLKNIKHVANKPGMSGGDVFNLIPEAGSMAISDRTWILIKSEGMKAGQQVVDDIRAFMKNEVTDEKEEW